jgi:hypothetical protein
VIAALERIPQAKHGRGRWPDNVFIERLWRLFFRPHTALGGITPDICYEQNLLKATPDMCHEQNLVKAA